MKSQRFSPSAWRRVVRRTAGFTLLELVVVVIIIATIAGLVIPQIGMIGRSTDMAASAKNQADLANNIQLYFVLQKRYPQGLDSLLDTAGALYGPADADGDGQQDSGLPDSGPHLDRDLVAGTLAGGSGYARSFTRSGFEFVYDHDRTVINSNNSGNTVRDVSDRSVDITVAEVTPGSPVAVRLLPATAGIPETGVRLVALGIGGGNAAISKTLTNAPIYPGCDGTYYGRYVAIFKIYNSGERATLAGVVDSYGRAPDYTQQQFNESLPNGSRRG